jgi:hypothetical protein
MKMEQTECFETSAYKIQTPGNYPEENIQYPQHGESLKSRTYINNQHYKNGDVFVFIEPSSGQFLKHSNGTVMSPSLQC